MAKPNHRNPVTVDTGGPDDIYRGALVTWLHEPRGGYGYVVPVDAKVLAVRRATVQIEVRTKAGSLVKRNVNPERLRWNRRLA